MRIMAVCANCQRDLLLSWSKARRSPADAHGAGCCWLRATPCSSPTPSGGPSVLGQSSSGPLHSSAKAGPRCRFGPSLSLIGSGRR
jgi:hypothetical protein